MKKTECPGPVCCEARDAVLPGSLGGQEINSHPSYKKPVILEPWSDAVGCLLAVEQEEGRCIAKIGPLVVSLPLELAAELLPMIGQRVAVLRTDDGYRHRRAWLAVL